MKKTITVSVLALFIVFAYTNLSLAQTSLDKFNGPEPSKARHIVETVFKYVFFHDVPTSFDSIRFDKKNKIIKLSNAKLRASGLNFYYGQIDIVNFQSASEGQNFTIDKVIVRDTKISLTQDLKKRLEATLSKLEKKLGAPKKTFTLDEENVLQEFDFTTYSGARGSFKENSIFFQSITSEHRPVPRIPYYPEVMKSNVEKQLTVNVDQVLLSWNLIAKFADLNDLKDLSPIVNKTFEYLNYTSFESFESSGPVSQEKQENSVTFGFGKLFGYDFKNGAFGEIGFKGIHFKSRQGTVKRTLNLDKFSLSNVSLNRLRDTFNEYWGILLRSKNESDLRAELESRAVKQVSTILKLLDGMQVKGLRFLSSAQNISGDYALNWGQFVGLFPTDIRLSGQTKISSPDDTRAATSQNIIAALKSIGIDVLDFKLVLRTSWDEKSEQLTISPIAYDANKLVELDLSVSLGKISTTLLSQHNPTKLMAHALGATIGPISLNLTDKGLQKLYALRAKGKWESLSAPFTQNKQLIPIIKDVTKLVNNPGGTYSLVLHPRNTLSFSQFTAAIAIDPIVALTLFEIDSRYVTP